MQGSWGGGALRGALPPSGAQLRWTQEPSSGGALMSRGHTVALPHRPLAQVQDAGRPGRGEPVPATGATPDLALSKA